MLAASLRRDIDDVALQEFQHCLLNTFSGNVTGDGRIVALACDLVDLVNKDYSPLSLGHIVVCLLKETCQDAFHIFAHITGLGEDSRIHDGERNAQHLCDSLGQEGLASTCGADKEDVRLLELDSVVRTVHKVVVDALVVIVDCYGEHLLGPILTYDILVQEGLYVRGLLSVIDTPGISLCCLLAGDILEIVVGQFDTVAADEAVDTLEKVRNFTLRPSAEHAMPALGSVFLLWHYLAFLERISSTMPYSKASAAVIQ